MSKLKLDNVTLLGIAGVNSEVEKFKFARDVCLHYADFEKVVIFFRKLYLFTNSKFPTRGDANK